MQDAIQRDRIGDITGRHFIQSRSVPSSVRALMAPYGNLTACVCMPQMSSRRGRWEGINVAVQRLCSSVMPLMAVDKGCLV